MTSLQVPAQLGLGEVELQEIDSVWDTIDQMLIKAMKGGFDMPARPPFPMPRLTPEQLANLNAHQFLSIQWQLEEWQSYAQAHMNQLEAMILQCDNQMEMIRVDTEKAIRDWYKDNPKEKKPSEPQIKEAVKHVGTWRALLLRKQTCQQEYKFVEPTYKNAARTKALLVSATQKQKADLGRS